MTITALIMAGGRGERFWPKSRKTLPKQFLSLTDDGKTMIQLTIDRILPLIKIEDIFIATNKDYKSLVKEQIPDIPTENILCEPMSKNTAPCIGLGAMHISKKYGEAIMIVLPSDHLIKHEQLFVNALKDACEIAAINNNLVTIGITPNYPETGYGYVKFNSCSVKERTYPVEAFVEKPSLEIAQEYYSSGEYLWNSGIFIWKISSLLIRFEEYLPNTYKGLCKIKDSIFTPDYNTTLKKEFTAFQSESIDYGIMEKAKDIFIIPCAFGWDDVGSWLALERIRKSNECGNIIIGNCITINTQNCIIEAGNKLIATVGLEEIIIVDTEDATLVCNKGNTNDIKKVLETLKQCKHNEYL